MKMIWSGWKIKENCHVLVNQFHGNFHFETPSCRKLSLVFSDVKWCFNASLGLKELTHWDRFSQTKKVGGYYSCLHEMFSWLTGYNTWHEHVAVAVKYYFEILTIININAGSKLSNNIYSTTYNGRHGRPIFSIDLHHPVHADPIDILSAHVRYQ